MGEAKTGGACFKKGYLPVNPAPTFLHTRGYKKVCGGLARFWFPVIAGFNNIKNMKNNGFNFGDGFNFGGFDFGRQEQPEALESEDAAVEKQRLDFICRNYLTAICSIWMIFISVWSRERRNDMRSLAAMWTMSGSRQRC